MATNRRLVFSNGYIYHVFNRGIDRRTIFTGIREYSRAQELIQFYKHSETPIRYSKFLQLPNSLKEDVSRELNKNESQVDILAYCLMPNHFHFMLQQKIDRGIPIFVSNFTNAYTRYFNTKHERIGPIFEGIFKAVLVESDEQFIHLSRYIHLNPVVSSVINESDLNKYKWSSYPEYISILKGNAISNRDLVMSMFESTKHYEKFVLDHVEYGKKLELIKHLTLE
ncbi:MAG: transposase [Candidatus Levybacteria bacterium]|nr:transposase [Candidatus Levybacteria bacterium]